MVYLEFKITSPEYCKNCRNSGLLGLVVNAPCKFLSLSNLPSLALVSPTR